MHNNVSRVIKVMFRDQENLSVRSILISPLRSLSQFMSTTRWINFTKIIGDTLDLRIQLSLREHGKMVMIYQAVTQLQRYQICIQINRKI